MSGSSFFGLFTLGLIGHIFIWSAGNGFNSSFRSGRLAAIAERHIEALTDERSSLIIAPTHVECRAIAGAVRQTMKEQGLLLDIERSVTRLERLNLTDSQLRDAVTYEPGQIVEFHRMARGAVSKGVKE